MSRTPLIIIFFLAFTSVYAQGPGPQTQLARKMYSGTAIPTFSCTPGPIWRDYYTRTTTNAIYECTAAPNTWTLVVSGGVPGTVTSIGTTSPITGGTITGSGTIACATCEVTGNKDATGGYAGLTLFKIDFKNAANTFTSFFTNANSVARTYTFQNRDGTIADDTDLALKAPTASPTFTGTVALPTGITVNGNAQTFPTTAQTIPGMNQANTAGSSFTLDMSSAGATAGHKVPVTAGAVPTANGAFSYDSTANGYVGGVNGVTNYFPIATKLLTFSGATAARTITIPDANFTVARTDAANTFTGVQTMTSPAITTPAFSGTWTGTYTIGGTPTINAFTLAGTITTPSGGATVNNATANGQLVALFSNSTSSSTINNEGTLIRVKNTNSTNNNQESYDAVDSSGTSVGAIIFYNRNHTGTGDISIAPGLSGTLTNAMMVFSTGGVSVGDTTDPGTTNLRIAGGLLNVGITSDATHTDSAVCQDTTTHRFYAGSGAAGICLGTSSLRFKRDVAPLTLGLTKIRALKPVAFNYLTGYGDNGVRRQPGFLAEDVYHIMPSMVGLDTQGRPQSVDYMGIMIVQTNALKELAVKVERLENEKSNHRHRAIRRHHHAGTK